MLFWNLRISLKATVPGLYRCGFFIPPRDAARGPPTFPVAWYLLVVLMIILVINYMIYICNSYLCPRKKMNPWWFPCCRSSSCLFRTSHDVDATWHGWIRLFINLFVILQKVSYDCSYNCEIEIITCFCRHVE